MTNPEYPLLKNITAPAPRYLMRLALLEEMLLQLPDTISSFLEIGPGMGDVSSYVVSRYPGIQGKITDISEESIDIVSHRLGRIKGIDYSVSDFTGNTNSDAYDLVIACEVFEHIEDDDNAFRAVHRQLKKGAYFIFSAPAFMKKWGPADQYGGHIRRYEKQELSGQFAKHGFDVIHFWSYGFPVTNMISPVSKLYYALKNKSSPMKQASATKRSGTERKLASRIRHLPYNLLMSPFFLCQKFTRELNVGDGYIVLARKI